MCMRQPSSRLCMEEEFGIGIEDEVDDFLCFHSLISSILLHSSLDPGLCFSVQYQYSRQGFKFRFDSHFGLDIETEYFVFRIVSVYHFGVHRIYIYIYIYINFLI